MCAALLHQPTQKSSGEIKMDGSSRTKVGYDYKQQHKSRVFLSFGKVAVTRAPGGWFASLVRGGEADAEES